MSFDTEVAADSPRSWWRFQETSGTTAIDSGADGNDGTYNINVALDRPGHSPVRSGDRAIRVPYAFPFGGGEDAGGYMEAMPSIFGTPSSFTVEAVIAPDGPPGTGFSLTILNNGLVERDLDGWGFHINGDDGAVVAWITNAVNPFHVIGGGAICWTNWNHVACTFDGSTLSVYQAGALVGSVAVTGGLVYAATRRLLIGRQNKALNRQFRWFDGRISEVMLYDSALSGARIAAHADAAIPWCSQTGWVIGAGPMGTPIGTGWQ